MRQHVRPSDSLTIQPSGKTAFRRAQGGRATHRATCPASGASSVRAPCELNRKFRSSAVRHGRSCLIS